MEQDVSWWNARVIELKVTPWTKFIRSSHYLKSYRGWNYPIKAHHYLIVERLFNLILCLCSLWRTEPDSDFIDKQNHWVCTIERKMVYINIRISGAELHIFNDVSWHWWFCAKSVRNHYFVHLSVELTTLWHRADIGGLVRWLRPCLA